MSTFNELGERGLNAVLQARANMTGVAPSPAMMPEIGPTLALEVDRPEWGYWKNEIGYSFFYTLPALVGEVGGIWIDPTPGYIQVITRLVCRQSGILLAGWRTPQPTWSLVPSPPAISFPFQTDNSAALNTPFQVITGYATTGNIGFDLGNGGEPAVIFQASTTGQELQRPIVMRGNGRPLLIRHNNTNNAFGVFVEGYTRPENPNERLG